MRNRWVLVLAVLLTLFGTLPVVASDDVRSANRPNDIRVPIAPETDGTTGYANQDPLGLIHEAANARYYSSGSDVIQVWACNSSRTPAQLAADLTRDVRPYFRWISNNRYDISFVAGGVNCPTDGMTVSHIPPVQANGDGAVFIDDTYWGGLAGPGYFCVVGTANSCSGRNWRQNQRFGIMQYDIPVIVHEIGHMIFWDHVYSGASSDEYDETMDVMSGGSVGLSSGPFATTAINRYAAGWFGADQVVIHASGSQSVDLKAPGSGVQMAVIRDTGGSFFVITPRVTSTHDPLPTDWQGVTVHRVTPSTLAEWGANPTTTGLQRVSQWPAQATSWGTWPNEVGYLIRPGGSKVVGGVTVKVESIISSGARVSLSGTAAGGGPGHGGCEPVAGFSDVCGDHTFAADISWLATEGITRGCNPPTNTRYCPDAPVTRAQMATFLVRALDLPPATTSTFRDVTATNAHRADIAALAQAGITRGCNPAQGNTNFCPDAPVTRAQMASFLTRALDLPGAGTGNFTDVPANNAHRADIASLANAGITRGCNPPTNNQFCPTQSVTRAQMAAFLNRALG